MTARILDGKATAAAIRGEIAEEVREATARGLRPPGLAVVIVGENAASKIYVRNKRRACEEAGFHSVSVDLPATTPQPELLETIAKLNADPSVDGILCQLPLPPQIDAQAVIMALDPDKDVDGFHPVNTGRLATGLRGFIPCTPLGCQELLRRHAIPTDGRRIVVLGRSNIVGVPMALLMMQKSHWANATVTVCHSRTRDLPEECRRAEILIAAIGRARMVTADFVKPGATVIDVGINRIDDATSQTGTRVVGDVDFEAVKDVAGAITPVPGGVGPMTIAMLLSNTATSWRRRLGPAS